MIHFIRSWIKRYFSDPQVLIVGVLVTSGGLVVYFTGRILAPVLTSIVIAYLMDGATIRLQQWKVPRTLSFITVFALFLAALVLLVGGLLPIIWGQIAQLIHQLPRMIASGQQVLMRLPENYPDFISEHQIREFIDLLNRQLTQIGQHVLSVSLASIRGLFSAMVYLVVVPLLVYFFLKDKEKILAWLSQFLPEERGLAKEIWTEVNQEIGNYIRGKMWEIFIIWAVTYLAFAWLGLEFSLLISFFVGLSVIIPYIGAIAMFVPVAFIAYSQWGWAGELMWTVSAYVLIQVLDGNLLAPLLLSGVVNLHPVAIITAVIVFGGWWGFWGLVFAIPLATLAHAVIKAFFVTHTDSAADRLPGAATDL